MFSNFQIPIARHIPICQEKYKTKSSSDMKTSAIKVDPLCLPGACTIVQQKVSVGVNLWTQKKNPKFVGCFYDFRDVLCQVAPVRWVLH